MAGMSPCGNAAQPEVPDLSTRVDGQALPLESVLLASQVAEHLSSFHSTRAKISATDISYPRPLGRG